MANRFFSVGHRIKRSWWLAAVFAVLCACAALWLTSKTTIQKTYWSFSRDVEASLLSDTGRFDHQALKRFSLQLRDEPADGFRHIVDANPGFLQQLERDLSHLVINYPALDNQAHHHYLLAMVDLVFALQLISEKPTDLQYFLQQAQDVDTLLTLMLRPAEGGWALFKGKSAKEKRAKEERIAAAAKLVALKSVEGTLEIDKLYAQAKDQRSADRIAERGLLQAMWLRSVAPDLETTNGLTDVISLAFEVIVEAIKTESDLIRLLSHENAIVALGAARTVGLLAPEHALPAIRYQLIKSSSWFFKEQPQQQLSLEQAFALLDALAAYGEQGRIAEPQLKKMIMLTRNDQLRNKIQHTLDHLYGRNSQDGSVIQDQQTNG